MNLQDLGFTPFEYDGIKLHSKDFPEINYTLCESDNGTFSISTYKDGNIIVRLPMDDIEKINEIFSTAEMHITDFKNGINTFVQYLNK